MNCPMCGESWNGECCQMCGWFEGKKPRYTEPHLRGDHDGECESELTSHGYTECRCSQRRTNTPHRR